MHHNHLHFAVLDVAQGVFQSLDGALYVCLDYNVQFLQFPFLNPVEDIVQGYFGLLLFFHLHFGQTFFCNASGSMLISGIHDITGGRHIIKAQYFYRGGRQCFLYLFAPVVDHGPDLAVGSAGQDAVPNMQGAPVNQHSGYRASALIQFGFDHSTVSRQFGVGLQFQHISYQQNHFQNIGNTGLLTGRNGNHNGVAAPGFRNQPVLGQLLHNEFRVSPFFIDFVDGHNNGHLGSFGVVDGFQGLGHHTIVGSHYQNGNIRYLGASGTHSCKGFVARRIQEDNRTALADYPVSTDVLGNTAGFPCRYVGFPDGIQKGSLAVVNVAHNRYNRRSGYPQSRIVLHFGHFRRIGLRRRFLYFAIVVQGNQFSRFMVDFLVDGYHLAQHKQLLDNFAGFAAQLGGKFFHADAFPYFNTGRSYHFSGFLRRIIIVVVFMFMVMHHMIGAARRPVFPGRVRTLNLILFLVLMEVGIPFAHFLAGMGTVHSHRSCRFSCMILGTIARFPVLVIAVLVVTALPVVLLEAPVIAASMAIAALTVVKTGTIAGTGAIILARTVIPIAPSRMLAGCTRTIAVGAVVIPVIVAETAPVSVTAVLGAGRTVVVMVVLTVSPVHGGRIPLDFSGGSRVLGGSYSSRFYRSCTLFCGFRGCRFGSVVFQIINDQ